MARPHNCRRVAVEPGVTYFKPRGVPLRSLAEVVLGLDEMEALRLADLEGLYHEEAATRMGISRPTFGRIAESARKKVADALFTGKAIRIEGGKIEMAETRRFTCFDCRHEWELPVGTGRPAECPICKSENIGRAQLDAGGAGRGRGRRRGARRGARD